MEGIGIAGKGIRSGVEDLTAIPSPPVFGVGFGYVAVFNDIDIFLGVVGEIVDGSAVARPIKELTGVFRGFGLAAAADSISIEDIGAGEDDLFGRCGFFTRRFLSAGGLLLATFLGGSFACTGVEAGIMRSGARTTAAGGQEQGTCG